MPQARPCLDCGRLTNASRCATCNTDRNKITHGDTYYRTPEWRRLSKRARVENGGECALCASTRQVQAHHAVHRTEGGKDDLSNLVLLCGSCHRKAHTDQATDRLLKAIVNASTP